MSTGPTATLHTPSGAPGWPPASHSAGTCPLRPIGVAMPTPPGTPAPPASLSIEASPNSLPGPAGTPSSARSASSFLPSRHAPTVSPAAPTWLGSARSADPAGGSSPGLFQMSWYFFFHSLKCANVSLNPTLPIIWSSISWWISLPGIELLGLCSITWTNKPIVLQESATLIMHEE